VSFAPLAVFVRGGKDYQRIEPDFVILKSGVCLVVEIDGDTYHQETPAEAHARTTMLQHEGASIERYPSTECDTPERATRLAKRIVQVIEKIKRAE
jgi:very-short-patch-repair endonuclease